MLLYVMRLNPCQQIVFMVSITYLFEIPNGVFNAYFSDHIIELADNL